MPSSLSMISIRRPAILKNNAKSEREVEEMFKEDLRKDAATAELRHRKGEARKKEVKGSSRLAGNRGRAQA